MDSKLSLKDIFTRNITVLQVQRGMELDELAERCGYTKRAMRTMCAGKFRYIDPDFLELLIKALNCTPSELFLPINGVVYAPAVGGKDV